MERPAGGGVGGPGDGGGGGGGDGGGGHSRLFGRPPIVPSPWCSRDQRRDFLVAVNICFLVPFYRIYLDRGGDLGAAFARI
jgi:hypothetical protein